MEDFGGPPVALSSAKVLLRVEDAIKETQKILFPPQKECKSHIYK